MENCSVKYYKVELLIKTMVGKVELPSINKIEFENCSISLTGDYLIVTVQDDLTTTGRVFNLSEVSAYKIHNKIIK